MNKIGLSGRRFTTLSGVEVEPFYEAPTDGELPPPGEFPYTRGIYPEMYRARLWTMRQYAGFGSAEESNRRYKYLLASGTTGLSIAFDLPTQIGYDADHNTFRSLVVHTGLQSTYSRRQSKRVV